MNPRMFVLVTTLSLASGHSLGAPAEDSQPPEIVVAPPIPPGLNCGPVRPEICSLAGRDGRAFVRLELILDPTGQVIDTQVLEQAASDAEVQVVARQVLGFRFKPFVVDGELVATQWEHVVLFGIGDEGGYLHCYEPPLSEARRTDRTSLGKQPAPSAADPAR